MALILNGAQRANGTLTSTRDTSLGCSYAITFKTGATVTGVRRTVASLNIASGTFRGMSVVIRTDGVFAAVDNVAGSDSDGISPYSNVTAQPNTIYRAVLVRSTTHVSLYINTIGSTYTRTSTLAVVLARIHHGGKFNAATFSEGFTGKIVRSAFWPSILSNADIAVCLDPLQTPANCSVTPQDYWLAIANDSTTNGSNSLVRINGAVYDADTLSAPVVAGGGLTSSGLTRVGLTSSGL